MQDETDGTPTGWKIAQRACISALDLRRGGPTRRARSRWRDRPQGQRDLLSHLDLLHLDLWNVWNDDDTVQLVPRRKGKMEKMFNFSVYHILDQQGCVRTDKNYRFSDNLPRSQALLEDQLSRITWRDLIFLFRGTVSLIYFGSLFCPTPRYAGEAPSYLRNDNASIAACLNSDLLLLDAGVCLDNRRVRHQQ